jgi:prepilin-type N-terminal cleavage/methylation domain-containing protein
LAIVTVKLPKTYRAFTLIEMLVVIGIMGALAAITVPALNNYKKADAMSAAARQLLDDVAYARQLAISHHTTVYMIFCPASFWDDPLRAGGPNNFTRLPASEQANASRLYDKQFIGYTFVTLRSVGEQPGRSTPRYVTPWRTLPEGVFIAQSKFRLRSNPPLVITDTSIGRIYNIYGFSTTSNIPFPSENAAQSGSPYVTLPYIAFNYLGQLTEDGVNASRQDEFIPLARGAVGYARDAATRVPLRQPPDVLERPPGNSTDAFNLIHIDWLTGRARLERQEISGS